MNVGVLATGVRTLLSCCAVQVVGPKADAGRIPGIDVQLADGDTWKFGE